MLLKVIESTYNIQKKIHILIQGSNFIGIAKKVGGNK